MMGSDRIYLAIPDDDGRGPKPVDGTSRIRRHAARLGLTGIRDWAMLYLASHRQRSTCSMGKSTMRRVAIERTMLPDGSAAEIEWLVTTGSSLNDTSRRTFMASRSVSGIGVWGQIFTPDPINSPPATERARELVAQMIANPGDFDRRRVQCVKCGAGSENRCQHPAPYTAW
jgi:hypothetical protein